MVLTFKLADDVVSTIRNVLMARGFVEFVDGLHAPHSCNFQWKTTRYADAEAAGTEAEQAAGRSREVQTRQRINHFQKTSGVCTKDQLARSLRRMSKTWGTTVYSFAPETFILPREAADLAAAMETAANHARQNGLPPVVWICKPSSSSQGKNIFLVTSVDELSYECSTVVQRYIANPMLIGGYKYDLRIYGLITSFRPLQVYLYREGLARFSSEKYTNADTSNLFAHLTNASINKSSPELASDKDVIGAGCKWTISQWMKHMETACGVNPYLLWEQIKELVLLTLLPIVGEVIQNPRSFELLGFDVMLDERYKPWIIEVNASPAIAISGAQDTRVKIPLLNDLLDAIGFRQEECMRAKDSNASTLAPGQMGYDPQAQKKADTASVAAHAAAVAHAAAAASGGAIATPADSAVKSTISGRGDKVQRVPRLVKLQSAASRSASAAVTSAAAAALSSQRDLHTRRAPNDTRPSSRIPRMPSASPVRSPSPLTELNAAAAAAPTVKHASLSKIPKPAARTGSAAERPRPNQTNQTAPAAAATSASAAPKSNAKCRVSSANGKAAPASSAAPFAPLPVAAAAARSTNRAPSFASSKAPCPSSASPSSSDSLLPAELIGDFERIFPFDAPTASASESLAIAAPTLKSLKAGNVMGNGALPVGGAAPPPLVLAAFAKQVIRSIRARARDRDRVAATRARARAADPSLPLRHSFVPASDVPSPWTAAALEAAVARAKEAARNERARLGIPEPVATDSAAGEERDEARLIEEAIHAPEEPPQDDALGAAATAAAPQLPQPVVAAA